MEKVAAGEGSLPAPPVGNAIAAATGIAQKKLDRQHRGKLLSVMEVSP
ncbi:hypothetical protein THTE_0648 [Thermogutta terrifontis]|uniref:Uncharacterized protein n=1 Tax=Thermogutta terrifontis TaxID=1331910 RepID=A0A286RBB6_9BACT|nr:hypothetical protein THTE_0648 [Thermogutta terrifontis]